jgi:hypothetical protein
MMTRRETETFNQCLNRKDFIGPVQYHLCRNIKYYAHTIYIVSTFTCKLPHLQALIPVSIPTYRYVNDPSDVR